MAATTRALTPTHSGPFSASIAPETQPSFASASQANSLAPIAAAATAAALRASSSPRPHKSVSPHPLPLPLSGAAALEDERRSREQRAAEEGRKTSPNPSAAVVSSLLGNQTTPAAARMADAPATAQKALQIQSDQTGSATGENMQTSPVSISSMGSLDIASVPATTASTLATAMPTSADNAIGVPDQGVDRPAVDPGITGPPHLEGPRAYTFPPPPSEDPRIPTPQRSISLQSVGYPGGSPRSGSGQRRHKCPYCSTDFTRHHNLKSHLLTHSQEKPYECETCQSRFRRLHDLKRHQKLHTGERPHTCQKCGRKFARGDALARHNKGQGGCAGRRSSFGVDRDGEGMDGVEYTAEPEHMDDDEMDEARRRATEPSGRQNSLQGGSRQSSTYPPLSAGRYPGNANVAPMYPPSSAPSHQSSGQTTGGGASMPPYGAAQHSVFAQAGMTESPKPISPGQSSVRHPGLPPPPIPGSGSSLPSLSNVRGPGGSHQGSASSHSGSGASIRDFLGRSETDVFNYARDLEGKLSQMEQQHRDLQSQISRMQEDHQKTIGQLQDEIRSLKGGAETKAS